MSCQGKPTRALLLPTVRAGPACALLLSGMIANGNNLVTFHEIWSYAARGLLPPAVRYATSTFRRTNTRRVIFVADFDIDQYVMDAGRRIRR